MDMLDLRPATELWAFSGAGELSRVPQSRRSVVTEILAGRYFSRIL